MKHQPPPQPPLHMRHGMAASAFTLLELLLSMMIITLVLVLVLKITGSMQAGLSTVHSSVQQRQDGRLILAALSEELREALRVPASGFQNAAPGGRQLRFLINPPTVSPALPHSDAIFWSANAQSYSSGTVLLGYAVRWDESVAGKPRPQLCRMMVPAPESQQILERLQNDPATTEAASLWIKAADFDTHAPGDAAHGYRGWLADHVLALYIRALDPLNQPITHAARGIAFQPANLSNPQSRITTAPEAVGAPYHGAYDSQKGYQYQDPPGTGTRINRYGPVLPTAVEVAIIVVTPRALAHISTIPPRATPSPATMWSDIDQYIQSLPAPVREGAQVYSTLIPIPERP